MAQTTLFTREQIDRRVAEMAAQISSDLAGTEVIALCVLKGAMFFCADLVRQMEADVALDFIQISSYGNQKYSSGVVTILKEPQLDMRGKSVLIVEDIIDSGLSIREVQQLHREPRRREGQDGGVPRQAESTQSALHAGLRRIPDRPAVRDRLRARLRGEVPEHPGSASAVGLKYDAHFPVIPSVERGTWGTGGSRLEIRAAQPTQVPRSTLGMDELVEPLVTCVVPRRSTSPTPRIARPRDGDRRRRPARDRRGARSA